MSDEAMNLTTYEVYDAAGTSRPLPEVWSSQTTILAFLRHFG